MTLKETSRCKNLVQDQPDSPEHNLSLGLGLLASQIKGKQSALLLEHRFWEHKTDHGVEQRVFDDLGVDRFVILLAVRKARMGLSGLECSFLVTLFFQVARPM